MSIFGTIKDANQIEVAVRDTLKNWFLTYKREFELQRGLDEDALPNPRSYVIATEVDRDAEDQLPSIVVVSPGLAPDEPMHRGDGHYVAQWSIGVGVFVSAIDRAATSRITRWYCAIIRAIMLQKASMGGIVVGTQWVDESYDELDFDDGRTIGSGQVVFWLELEDVVDRHGGPAEPTVPDPDTQPGSNWPLVDTALVDIDML